MRKPHAQSAHTRLPGRDDHRAWRPRQKKAFPERPARTDHGRRIG